MTIIRSAVVVGAVLFLSMASPAAAQNKPPEPKGVAVRNLLTSLGGFTATVNAPRPVTGATVTLEPGGQTGRQPCRVRTFVYVVEAILTTFYEAGPVGIAGAQYHAAGQAFMDNGSWWHNHANKTDKPVKYLLVHIGYPGRPDPTQKAEPE